MTRFKIACRTSQSPQIRRQGWRRHQGGWRESGRGPSGQNMPRRRRYQGGWRESWRSRSQHGQPMPDGYQGGRRELFCTGSKGDGLRGLCLLLRHLAHLLPQHRGNQRRGCLRGHHLVCPGHPGLLPTLRRADLRTQRVSTHRTAWQPPFLCLLLHGSGGLHRSRRIGCRRLLTRS